MRAHIRAALLATVFILPACSDFTLPGDVFTQPSLGPQALQLPVDSVKLGVGKVFVIPARLPSGEDPTVVGPVLWKTSDTTVATVTSKGEVHAVAPGTATVTATAPSGGAPATVTVTVAATPAAPTSADTVKRAAVLPGAPELPRVTVDVSMPSGTGRSIQLNASGNLQAAIDDASPGDQIVLPAGATFTGNFTLPAKNGSGWIVIRSGGTLPAAGTRVHPTDAAQMPRLVAADPSQPVIQTALSAHNYRLVGLEITARAGAAQAGALVSLGDATNAQNSIDKVAHDLVLDRVYIHGTPTLDFRRCIALNSGSTAIVDSYISECHSKTSDAQAIASWNGAGPYRIENNHLEGSTENVSFGGGSPTIPDLLPRDIVIRRNHFFKPLAWKGVWEVKNLLEFKVGQRVLIEGNIFENNWVDAQDGYALLFKSVDQYGTAPWSQTSDLTFRNNIVRNTPNGVKLAAHPEDFPVVPAARMDFTNNVFENLGSGGKLFAISGIQGLTIQHNTGFAGNYGFVMYGAKVSDFVMRDNIFGSGDAFIKGGGTGAGTATLNAYATPGWVFQHNVIVGEDPSTAPPNNFYPASRSDLNLDASYGLPAGSPFRTASTIGGVVGADINAINGATSGVDH